MDNSTSFWIRDFSLCSFIGYLNMKFLSRCLILYCFQVFIYKDLIHKHEHSDKEHGLFLGFY